MGHHLFNGFFGAGFAIFGFIVFEKIKNPVVLFSATACAFLSVLSFLMAFGVL